MKVEEEAIFIPVLDTPSEVETANDCEVEVEDYSLRFVLPRIALVLLMASAVVGAPIILWRIGLGFGMLQAAGWGGVLMVLFSLAVFILFWRRRRASTRDIFGEVETVLPATETVERQTRFVGIFQYILRLLGKCWESFCGSSSSTNEDAGQQEISFKGLIQYGSLLMKENRAVFRRLAFLEKETYIYFMLAAIPELGLLVFGSTHLLWSPFVKSLLILTVPAGLVFGLAGLLAGLIFWKKTGQLKIPFLILVAIYLNFAYESGAAIFIR